MKVKLDENLPADLATRLRQAGHDVMDVVEEGLGGEDDPPVLKAATNEGRILMTFDLDFAADTPVGLQRELIADVRRIPHRFVGFDGGW